MCGSSLSRWLTLCLQLLVMVVFRTQGEVIAPSSMTAVAGLPFTLGCNVTIATGDTVKQVRWLNKHKEVLLAYEPGESVRTIFHHGDVELTSSNRNVSAITIKRAGPNDEGCYRCIFDIYPSGAQEGKTCLSIEVKVGNEGNKTAISGKLATMSCWYGLPDSVRQVLWRKTAEQGDSTTLAFFAKGGQPSIEGPYRGRTTLNPSLGDTQLSIRPVKTEDEGCYTCEFHAYPEGTRSATACLFVYVLPNPEINYVTFDGVIEANCTAAARPAAQMVWNVEGDNRTLGPSVSSSYNQGDGTTLVTSTLLLQEGLPHDLSVKCTVHHRGLDYPMSVNLNVGPALTTIISVSCVAALLLCCLCVCLCKCFLCRDN
uniref:Sc:d189 n=1 Tax=Hucho hucho TaxID=62062 RepID=A0A4W5RFQ8_9TELE